MSWIDKKVQSDRWGSGVVKAERYGGHELLVKYDNDLIIWTPKSELTTNIVVKNVPINPPPDEHPKLIETEQINRLRVLEALKFGVVPPNLKNFIFGRDEEVKRVKYWLQSRGGNLVVNGAYGAGKSHFLGYTRELALENGYAVAECAIDPTEAPLYKPKTIYRAIVKSFQYGEEKNCFQNLIKAIIKRRKRLTENVYIDTLLNSSVDEPYFWRWIEGDDTIKTRHSYPTIPNETTASNIICSLLSAFSYYCQILLDLKGLLILFDEAESYDLVNSTQQFQRGINFIKGLKMTADGAPLLLTENIGYYKGSVANEGEKSHLIYSGRNRVRYLFNRESNLKLVFAFTPTYEARNLCEHLGFPSPLELKRLERKDRLDAFEAIYKLFSDSREGYSIDEKDLQYITKACLDQIGPEVRTLVKGSIEALELREGSPETPIKELLS